MKPLVELRVLSGPALGAAIELGAGRYVVGADDGCDVVLAADTSVAGRHLTLDIHAYPNVAEDGIRVEARPVDGERVALNGVALPEEGATLMKGEAVGLGFSALAWRPCGESWGPITLVPLEFAYLAPGKAGVPETVAVSAPEAAGEPSAELAPDSTSGASGEGVSAPVPAPTSSSALSRWGASLILLALLIVLALAALGYTKTEPSINAAALALANELERAGIHTVTVLEAEDSRALLLRGEVADDEALDALTRIAGAQPLRTYLEVRVGRDLLRALQETLNAHDFYPEFSYADDGRLHFALYLKDGLTESRLLELGRDMPRLAQASRKVVYARDVAPVLARELRALGLDDARVNYLAGKVRLPYRLGPEAGQQLAEALTRVRQNLGAPIAFQMSDGAADSVVGAVGAVAENERGLNLTPPDRAVEVKTGVMANANSANDADSSAKNRLGGLDVMSVTLGAMPFVTMSDRQKLFSGAVLPNGFVLVGIHTDRLVLQKDQETFTHSLKEKP